MNTVCALRRMALCACLTFFAVAHSDPTPAAAPRVELKRVPNGGIQPQVAVDEHGTIHLVYFKGDPSEGDLFYTTAKDGVTFSRPIRVNSVPGSAVATGNIRGARIAVGRSGNVYVVWNGSAKMGNPGQGRSPMLFARLNKARKAFEPERNIIHTAYGIDGGGGIAADRQGRVYIFWHAPIPGQHEEMFRRVWMARSENDGKSFGPERLTWDDATGTCGCCSLIAYADGSGAVYVLFRSAQALVHRDMYLLVSTDHGVTFHGSDISHWKVGYCVMSSEALVSGGTETFAAWETEKQIHFGTINQEEATATDVAVSPDPFNQKYPSLAVNRKGLVLVSWTEGMRWKHGGSVRWRLIDPGSRHTGVSGTADGVPPWSLIAAYPKQDGNFVVLF